MYVMYIEFRFALTGIIVLLALGFFTPYLSYIPTPALGAIVICAVIHFIEHEEALHIWKTKRKRLKNNFIKRSLGTMNNNHNIIILIFSRARHAASDDHVLFLPVHWPGMGISGWSCLKPSYATGSGFKPSRSGAEVQGKQSI